MSAILTTTLMPIAFVILLWWASTGALIWLSRGQDRDLRFRLLIMTVVCALGFGGVLVSTSQAGAWPVYVGFVSALAIWAFAEFTFLAGMVTGSRRSRCPQPVSETRRFYLAFKTICHHEYLLVALLVLIGLIDLQAGSGMAFMTFAIMWIVRIGAKLTLFSGVTRLSSEIMPPRLQHMQSYFRQDRVGPLFWVATCGTALAFFMALYGVLFVPLGKITQLELTMLTTLIGLALLEQAFMVLPIQDTKLWRWAIGTGGTSIKNTTNTTVLRGDQSE